MKSLALVLLCTSIGYADCGIPDALQAIRPQAQWVFSGSDYNGLKWLDTSQSKPSATEVQAAIATCQTNATARAALKAQARLDVKNMALTTNQRLQALVILLDYDK